MRKVSLFFIITLLALSGCSWGGEESVDNNQNLNFPADLINVNSVEFENKTFSGSVFIKGYQTPSESYGMITATGDEIGFGEYDQNKEIFRGLVNQEIVVNFDSICQSAVDNCCRSLFYYCGQVSSWQKK